VLPALGQIFQPAYILKMNQQKITLMFLATVIIKHCPRKTPLLANLRAGSLLLFEEVARLFPALFLLKRLQMGQIFPATGPFDSPLGMDYMVEISTSPQ